MGGLIKLIKNFFSGILSFLSGLVGSKKSIDAPKTRRSPGYFLELHEDEIPKAAISKPTAEIISTPTVLAASNETKLAPKKKSSERSDKLETATSDSNSSNGSGGSVSVVEKAPVAVAVAPKPEASVEFATKYLVPTSNGSRRRPGANMNSYLDMARDMKSN